MREIVHRPHTTPLHREFEQYMPTNPHVKQIVDDKTYMSIKLMSLLYDA